MVRWVEGSGNYKEERELVPGQWKQLRSGRGRVNLLVTEKRENLGGVGSFYDLKIEELGDSLARGGPGVQRRREDS